MYIGRTLQLFKYGRQTTFFVYVLQKSNPSIIKCLTTRKSNCGPHHLLEPSDFFCKTHTHTQKLKSAL